VITSVLSDGEGLEGLALVRRQALMEPELLAGERRLKITTPVGFTAAPVGAGGRQPS
jgi:hypothetical protein